MRSSFNLDGVDQSLDEENITTERPSSEPDPRTRKIEANVPLSRYESQTYNFKKACGLSEFKNYMITICKCGITYLFVVLLLMCYVLGCLFKSTDKAHNMSVLAVNLDGGILGNSLQPAFETVKADDFLSFQFHSADEYPTPESIYHAVWHGDYWAAIYVSEGASNRFEEALSNSTAAENYDNANAVYYVWNQAHYSSVSNDIIQELLMIFGDEYRIYLQNEHGYSLYQNYFNDTVTNMQLQALLNPISLNEINIMPTPQLESFLYNTICMVIVSLVMFFFMMGTHMISIQFQIYSKFSPFVSYVYRFGAAQVFGFIYSLLITGTIWWFREGWGVNGNQFVLTWLVFYLLMSITFLFFDCFACVLPVGLFPVVVIIWVILSVMSTLVPLALTPGFYHWHYALPAFNTYNLITSIWSRGADPVSYRALPILFGWLIVALAVNIFGHRHRCKNASQGPKIDDATVEKLVEEI